MRIGIVTFHWSKNYGAALQAYALKIKLENMGYDVNIINYKPKYPKKRESLDSRMKDYILKILLIMERKNKNKLHNNFYEFEKNYFNETGEIYYNINEINNIKYDCIISGSDQLWNPKLTGGMLDRVYFCDFDSTIAHKYVAYAASIGEKNINFNDATLFTKYLKNFNYISVRERNLIDELGKYTDKNIDHVLDPTLLLDSKDYKIIEQEVKIEKPYLLIYQNTKNSIIYSIAKKIAKQKKLKIYEVAYRKQVPSHGVSQITFAGPREFLYLFNNADFILTNTFHGTVFSIIYKKDFISIPLQGRESRVESLTEKLKLKNRLIYNKDENIDAVLKSKINYDEVYKYLDIERIESQKFLEMSING
ncbi:polysaccharide pyruvyl transferase family protein [Clostridium cadaveris]|uniref:polysaccharide pyruvyl transferase family protein n=1 Tax=Clostridium cadaveris TaxID=1529 RepID=UPI001459C7AB|nr:polysaccharide pyruvyl transferase family protein [Clostridium cadaveris]NME63973.1 polysaccharide pyruvyl transferase family protein [Clostridium cadaveris]